MFESNPIKLLGYPDYHSLRIVITELNSAEEVQFLHRVIQTFPDDPSVVDIVAASIAHKQLVLEHHQSPTGTF